MVAYTELGVIQPVQELEHDLQQPRDHDAHGCGAGLTGTSR